ncbi:MAG: SPOR domain-containing protein [Gammaproteobacteria bacterium]|jgi:hypothetical protein|nr:SPOR domain-containing protein [Gammaproteobacteria bacterium]MBT7371405.1 SPOR domain-containing protein [Gammaproteobacteria bacterium]
MHRLALLLVCIYFSTPCAAEEDLWVLGSFANEINAVAQKKSLEQRLNTPVRIIYSGKRSAYRLVASADAISAPKLREYGLDPWLMPGIGPSTGGTLPLQEAKSTTDAPLMTREIEWTPLYPELGPDESIPEYCLRLPDSPLCTDPLSQDVLERARKLAEQTESLIDSCHQMTNLDLRATCLEIHNVD